MLIPVKKQRLSKTLYWFERPFKFAMDLPNADDVEFTDDQIKDATTFCDFYLDLIHSFDDKTKYFLSENVLLDYFGHTIKGQKNVTGYIKTNLVNVGHLFEGAKPAKKIGYRDTHVVKLPREPQKVTLPFFSPPKSNEPKTPVKSQPSTSRETRSARKRLSQLSSPAKRPRRNGQGDQIENSPAVETELVESESEQAPVVKFMTVTGQVEFRKPSLKKLQTECRWKRPCKLSVAYSSSTSRQDCCIYLIIYESNVKCRRNLLREFEEAEKED